MANQENEVTRILAEWSYVKSQLEGLFHDRNLVNTKEWMEQGINLLCQFLFVANGQSMTNDGIIPFHQFPLKPVNIEERFMFITSRPSLYHSFRQLSELMTEQEKLFVKNHIIKKSSRPKG